MAKSIKFNIVVNNKPIRDIEDLLENFNLDDILAHYKSGLLLRWLEVRNLNDQATELKSLNSNNNIETARAICRIFYQDISNSEIDFAVYHLKNCALHTAQIESLKKYSFARQQVIDSYHNGYEYTLKSMLENPSNYPLIKSKLIEIWDMYRYLFFTDFKRFFSHSLNDCPLAVFIMLTNENFRNSEIISKSELDSAFDFICPKNIKKNTDTTTPYETLIAFNAFKYYFEDSNNNTEYTSSSQNFQPPFYLYSGKTENYWKDIEPKGQKFMIIKMEPGNFVRNCGKSGEELSSHDINGNFLILDGIDYKSNNDSHKLLYMEV